MEAKPGQPDLCVGDVILWINGSQLLGLDEDEVTERFGAAFGASVPLVAGKLSELMKKELKEVEKELKKLLST